MSRHEHTIVFLCHMVFLKKVNPFPNKPWFLRVCIRSLENTVGKGEIARNEQFLLFPQCFQCIWRTYGRVHQICYCRLQTLSVWKSLKSVVWEGVKYENYSLVNPLQDDKILDWSKLKQMADYILKCI